MLRLWGLLLTIVLPSGWVLQPAPALFARTDTMPQGAALAPDGRTLAVVEAGFNPATLALYDTNTLHLRASIPLWAAFGRPIWLDAHRVLVAGAGNQSLLVVDTATRTVRKIRIGANTYPVSVARAGNTVAVATDDDGNVRIGTLQTVAKAKPVRIGTHPGGLAFSADGRTLFAADRSGSSIEAIDVRTLAARKIPAGLHPSDLLVIGDRLYVANSDDDSIGIYSVSNEQRISDVFVGDAIGGAPLYGVSPNALAWANGTLYVSLGAANAVAIVRDGRVVGRVDAGHYPTDIVPVNNRLFVVDGKGEAIPPNPRFQVFTRSNVDYIGAIEFGSIRGYDIPASVGAGSPQGTTDWQQPAPADTVLRANGPIKHVFFILKENRTYDQILGDIASADGDAKLCFFGAKVTPNQHAIAERFGILDNAYTNGEVSDAGHNWSTSALANDFVERNWPQTYGGRSDGDDVASGLPVSAPHNGYIWDAAARAHVSFRDYGEFVDFGGRFPTTPVGTAPSLGDRYDRAYVSWNLDYSDVNRYKEWKREFDAFVHRGNLPQFEYIWLPNDHTYGSRPGKPTPAVLIAQNDYALGLIIQTISHSAVWKSSAIFVVEDDSQDGADHVSAQRTTMYIASPYARGGVQHAHYTTASLLRTTELILGMQPLSTYDAMAVPLYAAFGPTADTRPFSAIPIQIDMTARNLKTAYDAHLSATLDFSHPDAIAPGVLRDIIAHNRQY